MPLSDRQAREHVEHVEDLLGQIEMLEEGPCRDTAMATVEALVDLYGACLERVLEHAGSNGSSALTVAMAQDELLGHVLVAHGLLPGSPELTMDAEQPRAVAPIPVSITVGARRS